MKENYILSLLVPTLGIVASLITASMSYYFARIQQIRNENRKLKEEFYRDFIKALSDTAMDKNDMVARRKFLEGFNTLTLVASKEVVEKLMIFSEATDSKFAIKMGERYLAEHDKRLRDLIIEMRRDLFGNKVKEVEFPLIHLVGLGENRKLNE